VGVIGFSFDQGEAEGGGGLGGGGCTQILAVVGGMGASLFLPGEWEGVGNVGGSGGGGGGGVLCSTRGRAEWEKVGGGERGHVLDKEGGR